jgi:hypothetical protein
MRILKPGTSSRSHVDVHTVARWHATVEWFVPMGEGSAYTGWIKCKHDHKDQESALKCQRRLAYRIRNNPDQFPEVQRALDQVNERK